VIGFYSECVFFFFFSLMSKECDFWERNSRNVFSGFFFFGVKSRGDLVKMHENKKELESNSTLKGHVFLEFEHFS
jgi:hypothetical protein